MKRLGLLWFVAMILCLSTSIAEARHFHHGHWGHHHHWGGYGGYGWGGYGYRPWGYGYGYRPWGGVSISVGYGSSYYGGPNYGYGWGGYRPYGWGYYGTYYRPAVYRSYYSTPVWSTYDYYPSSYYYYPSTYYYYPSSYYYAPVYGYPAYGYPAWSYFGSTPSVKPTNFVLRKSEEAAPATSALAAKERTGVTVVRSSIDDRIRARQFVRRGDEAFREGRYIDALNRYRNAADRAPELAEAHFRKGHAYLANGQYSLAATTFRHALQLEPNARRDGFRLHDLYGKSSAAKDAHLENLAATALGHDDSADAYFLLGLMLHFDGQTSRAEKFFAKAASLSLETRKAVASFLPVETTEPVSLEVGDEI